MKRLALLALALPVWAADPLAPFLTGQPPRIVRDVDGPAAPAGVSVRRVVYASRNSEIFAVIARPTAPGAYPGLLVLHGGGGSAEEAKAIAWAARGYVVVAPDLPGVANPEKVPHSSGPWKSLKYAEGRWVARPDAGASTIFDGVVAAMQALYLLRSLDGVDTSRVGVTGISWGGYMTTMVASLAGEQVKAAFSVYGCGHYELTSAGGDGPLGKMPRAEREEWLKHLDPGRRASGMKAAYFVSGATNDFFYWPPGVMATLEAIPSPHNQVFAPNANHKATYPGGSDRNKRGTWLAQEVEYFAWPLKGEGAPFPEVSVITGPDPLRVRVRATEPAPIDKAELWWSHSTDPWIKRLWTPVHARRTAAGEYEARLPDEAAGGADWFVLVSDTRPVSVSSPLVHTGAIYVNQETGDDTNPGTAERPLRTAQKAVAQARRGDTIHLLPEGALYRQTITISGKTGIAIDGHGVTLSGADPLPADGWEDLGNGLRRRVLPATPLNAHVLVVNGKFQRMGRSPTRPGPFPEPEALRDGEFAWKPVDDKTGYLYVRGPIDRLEWGTRQNGIGTGGLNRDITIRNLNARHCLNDGFNIHGDTRGLRAIRIRGYENFDEGFSAHDTSQAFVEDSVFYGNDNAVADVNAADTYYTRCEFRDSVSVEVLLDGGDHELTGCTIVAGGVAALTIRPGGNPKTKQKVPVKAVVRSSRLVNGPGPQRRISIDPEAAITFDRCEVSGLEVRDPKAVAKWIR